MDMGSNKINNSELDVRVEKALQLMLIDRIKYDAYLEFAKSEYDISRNAANNYWVKARELRREYFSDKIEDNIITAIQELEELESRARLGDGAASMGIELKAKEIKFKIQGIFQDRLQINHSGEIKLNWGDITPKKDAETETTDI